MDFDPLKFVREVRAEVSKVTWPTRKETLVTTGVVFVITTAFALFFLGIDLVIGHAIQALFAGAA